MARRGRARRMVRRAARGGRRRRPVRLSAARHRHPPPRCPWPGWWCLVGTAYGLPLVSGPGAEGARVDYQVGHLLDRVVRHVPDTAEPVEGFAVVEPLSVPVEDERPVPERYLDPCLIDQFAIDG